ncbi:outer membrane beta-barrel protein [Hymenobacter wooponensis]|uniref:PorT family protein n=1 Tax=Hymenobacter wooponensis TaxID=1525360 RepID=A0A4Z0MPN8_9BACT|nr:outer membrane beta-barrel protein [Hymenobacter wooponensis]TGD81226.1 PorT family protein [Hymenobacter wooponensis]
MRTPDMSDEELDRLFQRGADAFPDETSLGGWLRLETQLDEVARQHQQRRQLWQRVTGLFVAEIGVVALFLAFWLNHYPSGLDSSTPVAHSVGTRPTPSVAGVTTKAATKQHSVQEHTTLAQSSSSPSFLAHRPLVTDAAPSLTSSPEFSGALQETRSGRTLRFSRPRRSFAGVASLAAGGSRTYRPAVESAALQAVTRATSEAENQVAFNSTPPTTTADKETDQAATGMAAISSPSVSGTDSVASSSAANPAAPTAFPTASADSLLPKRRPTKPEYRFLVGIVGGPELSAVLPSPSPRAGGTVGLVAEYRLTSRLRVRTGLLRSVKRYGARGTDYRPPAGYWTWRIPVDEVDANCRILEIPLDIRYEILPRAGYSFYASAGLTSLIMRNERYTYHYELNGDYVARTWSYPNGGKQALQMLRLAAGYERHVAPRWVVQAEPFLNVPLNGVGFGQMRLSSTGLLFGLRYGLGHTRTVAPAP